MWHIFSHGPHGNRVSKTRFPIQKNLSLLHKPKYPKKKFKKSQTHQSRLRLEKELRGRERAPQQRGLGSRGLGSPSWVARPGSCRVVVYLGRAQWSEADLKPPTSIAHSHLPVSFYFWFFFFFFFTGFFYGVILRYSWSTKNDAPSSHIHGGVRSLNS